MDKILKLYTYNGDAVESTPFPNELEQVVITDFQYDANRMGGSPSISATVMHRLCLDDLWTDTVYAEFNGEKYYVMNTPSSNKDKDDTRYEHEVELLSEREVLNHIYFIDAVQGDSTVDVYKSNSTKVIFMGDINEFASRLNSSLSYSKVGYNVVVDEGIVTEAKLVSFEDKYIMSALQEIFNIYEIPYYFVGKTIHIGYTDNTIPNVFKYGFEDALLSISKNNANYEVVRRCTGIGSSDNIPYYYPNESDDREAIEASGKKWITPTQNLMPPIYRETEGAERFYNAINNTYPSPEGGYYKFENLYSTRTPNEKIVSFEDIKPSIVGMTNANGQRIDQFIDIAFDENDNDEIDEEGNYIHSYFFVKLPKYNGEFGFNLFDHAIENGAMTISMTNGVCGACNFEIGVGEETNKNIVQVDENGNLKRDENGNVLWENQVPQDRQNDTQNYEVWIALKKEESTYGQIMPNASQNLKPSVGDTFVILNINLPQSYILAAEEKLKDSIIKYMFLNNNERFTFSVNFSRIYFAENPDVLATMNENARILIEYNGKQHTLYISSFSYKINKDSLLPEISVELTDELSVGQNSLQNALDSIKNDILSSIGGGDFLKQGLKYFIRKDINDAANGLITFNKGLVSDEITSKNFNTGALGSGYKLTRDAKTGDSYLEVDRALFRKSATFIELIIQSLKHVGGQIILSPASIHCIEVEETEDAYRCYFEVSDGNKTINNEFVVGDQARSQTFNIAEGVSENVSNSYYWRLVTAIGDNYIDLSKTDCDKGSTIPKAGDDIVQLGNRNTSTRQSAIVLSAFDNDAPSIKLYRGINSYSLIGKEFVNLSRPEISITADKLKFSTGEDVKETLDNSQFISSAISRATMLFDNPTFKEIGTDYQLNGISNYGNSTVNVKSDDLAGLYNDSGFYVEALVQGVNTIGSSGNGFLWVVEGSANAEYIAYFVAKFSSRLQVNHRSQSSTELTAKWLTSNKGTGNFELYAVHIKYGNTPHYNTDEQKFGRCCYFEFVRSGTSNVGTLPTPVYISYGTVYNLNSNVQVASSDYVKSQFQVLDNRISSSVSSLTSSINKVSSNLNEDLAQGLLDNTLFTSGAAMIYRSPYFLSNNRPTYNGLETNYYNSNLKMTYFSDNQEVAESLGITYLDIPLNNSTNVGLRITQVVNSGQPERLQYRVQPYAGNSYLISFEAKIPVGYKIIDIAYEIGSAGSSKKWLTPTAGTGDFTTYTYIIQYGTDITENIDYYIGFRLDLDKTGEAGSTQYWYLRYAVIYNMSLDYKNSQDLRQEIVARQTAIEQTDEKIELTAEKTTYNLAKLSSGNLVYEDTTFFNSWGGLGYYNNESGVNNPEISKVTLNDCPNPYKFALQITTYFDPNRPTNPGLGGVGYNSNTTKPNKSYVIRLTAKIPKGYRLAATSNAIGDGGTRGWFAGTILDGDNTWKDYFYEVHCGSTGTFGTTGYFYLESNSQVGTSGSVTWYICLAAYYDLNKNNTQEFKESVNTKFTQTAESIRAVANRFNADGTLKNTSGLVIKDDFAGLFSEAVTANGLVKKAELGTYVEYDKNTGLITTNVKISGDKINLAGATTINEYVKIGTDGKLYAKDAYFNGTIELGDAVKLDKSGLGWIGKNSDGTKAIEITSSGVKVNTAFKAKGGSTIGGLKISDNGTLSGVSAIIEDAARHILTSSTESVINNFIINNINEYSTFFLFFSGSGNLETHDVYLPNYNTLSEKRPDVISGILNLTIFVPRSSGATYNIKAQSGATIYDSNGSVMSQIALSKCDILELMLCIINDTSTGYLGTFRTEYYIKNLRQ